jgi:dienelactone hydrolase
MIHRALIPLGLLGLAAAALADPLPGTKPLDWEEEDFPERIMDGAHAFVDRKIVDSTRSPRPLLREEAAEASREELRRKLGVVDDRPPTQVEFFAETVVTMNGLPASSKIAEGPGFEVHQVRWSVLPGMEAEGLYVNPVGETSSDLISLPQTPPAMILFPDAGESPEDVLGLNANLPGQKQMGLRFASLGFRILIPAILSRELYENPDGDTTRGAASQSNREWIYRQAFQMGRHLVGYEIQTALAAADWLREKGLAASITVAGYGEGGRAALYTAAVDTGIDHAFVSGAFAPRNRAWEEPIDRNLFGLLPHHGDAEVAALISPRVLLVEHTEFPAVVDRKGAISTPEFPDIEKEFERIAEALGSFGSPPGFLLHHAKSGKRADYPAVAAFLQTIGIEREVTRIPPIALLIDSRIGFEKKERQTRVRTAMQDHVQRIVDQSESTRREFFFYDADPGLRPGGWSVEKEHPTLDPASFIAAAAEKRETFRNEIIGRFDEQILPLNPRSNLIRETDAWTAWNVVMEVYPGLEAWGVLVLPKGIRNGEKRPVVVCQHGRNGLPRDTIDAGNPAYNDFAARLAERGFITFAPHNLYRGEDRYRWLDRKANLIGCTLFSFITDSHEQQLRWLASLPEVDASRIAFYGLSYGGETAVRVPAVLESYCLSICSGDFNQWTRKVADPEFPKTFMNTIEWEMPYWNMGNTFDYGELAGLIFPRPFFVERGHYDGVSQDEWVAYEYARVRRLYSTFGKHDQTGIEFFPGGHSIRGEETFRFLHKHLDWPE